MDKKNQKIKERIHSGLSVYSATFIFSIKKQDSEFDRLNRIIDEVASSNPEFLGKESWLNDEENKQSVVYYWESLEALKTFSNHSEHQKAKQNYKKWYSGYEIVVAEVLDF